MTRASTEERNLNTAFIAKMNPANRLKVSFRTQNAAIYKSMMQLLKALTPEVQQCVQSDFCVEVSVNEDFTQKYLKDVQKMDKLAKKIRAQIRNYFKPGGRCAGPGCVKRTTNMRNYLRWLDRQITLIKRIQLVLVKKVPKVTTKCEVPPVV